MFIHTRFRLLALGLIILLTSCSAGKFSSGDSTMNEPTSHTDRGVRYLLGQGVQQDNERAFYYFNLAANDNDAFAQNEIAYMYAAGKGTSQDDAKAFYWYQKAADHGLASAQYNLALFYLKGIGTPPNRALAMQWFSKSAAHGFIPAKQALSS